MDFTRNHFSDNCNRSHISWCIWCSISGSLSTLCNMRGRRTNCLFSLLMVTMIITHHTPGIGASLILRGRWSASIDEADTTAVHGDSGHLRGLIEVLRDHQRRRPDAAHPDLERQLSMDMFSHLDSEIANRLMQAFEHQVETNRLETNRLVYFISFRSFVSLCSVC